MSRISSDVNFAAVDVLEAERLASEAAGENSDQVARYVFDTLIEMRDLANDGEHKFLCYLIGMAAEEAMRLAEAQPGNDAEAAANQPPQALLHRAAHR